MAFSTAGSCMTASFKAELPQALHNFTTTTGNVFKIALYNNSAGFSEATTVYSSTQELPSTGNYTQPGFAWTAAQNITPAVTAGVGAAFWSWSANPSWASATFDAYGAMIYNSTNGNRSVAILDFGGIKSVSSGTFTIVLPTNSNTAAILRIA